MVLLISYDLNGHERPSAYTAVRKLIEANSIDSRRPLFSQWFVQTDRPATWWDNAVRRVTDTDDNVFVCPVTGDYAGWLNREIWPWLRARI
jgi:hypothetical protein